MYGFEALLIATGSEPVQLQIEAVTSPQPIAGDEQEEFDQQSMVALKINEDHIEDKRV